MDDELGLYNKVGDLYLKIHNVNAAVDMYERAVNRYAESGFPNNAIALCNKILRSAPGRTHVYLQLAQLMAQRGFVAEAKKNFVEYADRMSAAGRMDEAFGALKRFADMSPENEEIRQMLAEQFKAAALHETGSSGAGSEVLQTVRALDPEYDLDGARTPPPATPTRNKTDLVFISLDEDEESVAAPPEPEPAPAPELLADAGVVQFDPPVGSPSVSGLETTTDMSDALLEVEPLEIETTSLAAGEGSHLEIESSIPELDVVDVELPAADGAAIGGVWGDDTDLDDVSESGASGSGAGFDLDDVMIDGGGSLGLDEPPGLSEPVSSPRPGASRPSAGASDPLDLVGDFEVGDFGASPAAAAPTISDLEGRVASDPDDPMLHRELAEALLEAGDRERGLQELEIALERSEAREEWSRAAGLAAEILRLEPNSIPHHQKRVEVTYRGGDRGQLISAYLDMANALFRTGALDRAEAIYRRVLEQDPDNKVAQNGLATMAPAVAEPPPPPPPSAPAPPRGAPAPAAAGGNYVDLGDLIMGGDETHVKDTRMRIEEDAPTGDEEHDFSQMLQQFKRGIEENLDDEDSQAHYDLGVAFKEMGLLDEAIAEFQKSLRGEDTRLSSAEMLGHCFMEKGQFEVASTVLRRAIDVDGQSDQSKIGLLYWLGRCEQENQRPSEALKYYQRVFAVDIHFQDVSQRVDALVKAGG